MQWKYNGEQKYPELVGCKLGLNYEQHCVWKTKKFKLHFDLNWNKFSFIKGSWEIVSHYVQLKKSKAHKINFLLIIINLVNNSLYRALVLLGKSLYFFLESRKLAGLEFCSTVVLFQLHEIFLGMIEVIPDLYFCIAWNNDFPWRKFCFLKDLSSF